MDSHGKKYDMIAPNSSSSAPLQDSTVFSYVSDVSPTKHFNGPPVAQSFSGLTYSPQVLTSPQINPQSQSSSLERPQYHHISGEYSKQKGDQNDDIAPFIYTPGKLNTDLSYQVNSHDVGHSSNNSAHGEGGITSEYLEYLLKMVCDDAGHVSNSSLKQFDTATPKDFAECINYSSINGEKENRNARTELQLSAQHSQLHSCGGQPGVVSTKQNTVVQGSEVSKQMSDFPRRCLQYDESQQSTAAKSCGSMSQPNAASISRSFASNSQVLESSCAAIYAPPNSVEPENINKPTSSTFHAPKFGKPTIAVFKPSGIGLHLNSIVNAFPMGCGASASVKSADEDCVIVQGKKSLCTTDSHLTDNAGNPPTSSKAVDGLLKPTEHHSTSCDDREYTKLSSEKKRKRSTGITDEDGCKRCNCKNTKCLKLYCDCFASGYYCGENCSCQGCLNSPEYEDTVLNTRRHIVSRDPLAFAPKDLQRVGESPANSIQDINKLTPSSAKHKRGCNCKKTMCLKRYCQCYQSNVGCSDGCQCAGCKNVYGKKEATNLFSSEADVALSASHEKPSNSTKSSDNHKMIEEICQTIPGSVASNLQMYEYNSKSVDDFSPHRSGSNSLITNIMTNDTSSQPCPESDKLPVVLDSDSKYYNILEDDDITEILKEHPVFFSEVKERSPNKKRVSPPHSPFHELRPSSSMTALRGGRKFILKAVPSLPPLSSCSDVKTTSSQE